MKKKFLAVGAVAVAVTVALTGCSKTVSSGATTGNGGGPSIASGLILGGPATFKTRSYGVPGLQKVYNVQFGQFKVTDTGGPVTVNALNRGQVDAADLFTTDPSIKANNFVVLQDPEHMIAAQNIVPIIAKDKNTPAVASVINAIQAKLTTEGLSSMLDEIYNQKADPADVAKKFLADNGLDTSGTDAKGVSLTVGSADFPENELLADMYAQALQAHGASITTKLDIGSREKYLPALKSGSLSLFPEYNGNLLAFLDTSTTATATADVDAALKKALPSNLEALDTSAAQDSDAIVVTKATADQYHLTTIGDLAKPAS